MDHASAVHLVRALFRAAAVRPAPSQYRAAAVLPIVEVHAAVARMAAVRMAADTSVATGKPINKVKVLNNYEF